MQGKVVKFFLVFEICIFTQIVVVKSTTCGELENKIKSYKDEIESLKISLEEYELVVGKSEDISDECNVFPTCSKCFRERKNPDCGWCVLRNRCSLSHKCPANNSSHDFWISGSDRCPKIRAVTPHNLQASTAKVLQIIIPHLPDYDGTFVCSFEVLGKTLVTKGKKLDRGITCSSPYPSSLPIIPVGDDHMRVKLSLRTPNGPNFASTSNFTIYDCSRYQTCSECSDSDFPCAWCLVGNKCTHDIYENCRNDIIVFSKLVSTPTLRQGPGYCPTLSSFAESEDEIFVHSGSIKRIFANVENLMVFHADARFTCKVKGFAEVTGHLLANTVYCNDINFRVLGRQPVYNLSFNVFWNGKEQLDNPRNLHVVVYHCERLATSCGECVDLPIQYNCGWCEESHSCSLRHVCAESVWTDDRLTCSGPEITSIHPPAGLLNRQTNLTIVGVNLAKEFKDVENVAIISEEGEVLTDCMPYEHMHVRHSRIVCLLDSLKIQPENNATLRTYIEVKLSNNLIAISEQQFSFVDPVITGFQPVKGMESGGTILKITGYHLDAGNEVEVYIGDLPCHIISRDRSSIRCISSSTSTHESIPKSCAVRVLFDGEERTSSSYFFYVADPSVSTVKGEQGSASPVGTPSGGNLILVEGTNFDYAPNPYIYIIVDGVEYPGACSVISEARMECLSPRIPVETLTFCGEEGSRSLHYGFKMGHVKNVQNISYNQNFNTYKLFPDPYLMPFSEERKIKTFKSDYLTIQGKYLDTVFDENDYAVTVGGQECRLTSLSHTQLTCRVPDLQTVNYDENRLPEVQVKIRESIEYFIGFLQYEKE